MRYSPTLSFFQIRFAIAFSVVYMAISLLLMLSRDIFQPARQLWLNCVLPVGGFIWMGSCRETGMNTVLPSLGILFVLVTSASLYRYVVRKDFHPLFPVVMVVALSIASFVMTMAAFMILMIVSEGA